jgi:hypothetical protein
MKAINGEQEEYLIAEIVISGITTGFLLNKAIRYVQLIYFKH